LRRSFRTTIAFVVILVAFLSSSAVAQTNKGTISGQVTDPSGDVVQGAQLQLPGITVSSDALGAFFVSDLAPGDYKVVITYVGFKPFETTITVKAGADSHVDARMEVAPANQSITVTDQVPHGEAEAINITRSADNILQVLPAEVITSLPNANVADALGRMPSIALQRIEGEGVYIQVRGTEPRLTNVMIDGITVPSPEPGVNQIRLDVVPADLVESVQVNKTLAPNIDGDGIGGSVNLVTKTAGEFPTVDLFGLGGYNPIMGGRNNNQFGATVGHRFGPEKKFGVLFGATEDYNGRGIDNEQPAIDPASTFAAPYYDNTTLREYRYYRTRWGYTGNVDYKIGDNSDIYVRGLYSNLKDYGDKWYYEPQDSGNPKFYTSSKRPDASIGSLAAGGHKQFTSSLLSWEVSAARSYELDSAGNPKATFKWIGSKLNCGFLPASVQTNPNYPQFGSGCDALGSPLQAASNFGLNEVVTSTGLSAQVNLSASADYLVNYHLGSHLAILQFGGKIRNAHKFQDATETQYDGWSPKDYPMTLFQSNFSSHNYMNDHYFGGHYGQVSNFESISAFTQANLASYVDGYATASDAAPNQFDILERISAAYIMNTMDIGHLHVVAGIRFEATQMNTSGYYVTLYGAGDPHCVNPTGCGVPVPEQTRPSYVDPLPSVSLRYPLGSDSGLRLVYGRGVSRPDAYQLVPYVTEDDSTNPATIDEGNTKLNPEHANNYDLLYERYMKSIGLFQAGFFYKQLSDTLISASYSPATGQYVGDLISQWLNVGGARLYGFEASYQQRLNFLPGPLAGLGIMANYAWTGSKVSGLPGRPDRPALQSQVPSVWNISPDYSRGRFNARLGLSYNSANIYQYLYQSDSDPVNLGPRGPNGDIYTLAHLEVDAQASVRLGRGITAMVYGLNLNNEVFGFYQGSPIFVNQQEWYKPTVAVGLRYSFNHENR
jgi:TonB-dependent receptor